ncbi:pyrroloquinoline quinone biosynthesis protein PqqE [Shimia thalassica]|uniref:pyrroloquinoline quinone biosynthesis protein PqqE n=1 Tax=Shimia thalassica TaxID=1715693 RepID=UPI00249427AE|nr:pyrroloquinoline quinone biosynthesis protein PqqE [Shimia thalassica]MDO6481020.1 pyrroloquinoline quinone biosynthesis protein PqqE [Shimia thalassica]MDP2496046.1 pyrroloquinoline quinone biosynthesis protein PqqE [Shimia thalassica]MDP2581889.1 pyrroloquinoline quinone biosynthesis protein PqqE [Shimia thalassica]
MSVPAPIAMLAELTHRCPLACPYCSNPTDLLAKENELDTGTWLRVFKQAADMGVLQLHLSGGEPASRHDIVDLMQGAHDEGLYTNLITSGIGLTPRRLDALEAAGMDHIQLSMQGTTADLADWVGGYKGGFDRKMKVAGDIAERGIPLTLNAVMHRHNLDDLERTIEMAVELGARRLEVACVQFHGWASQNRSQLLPSREQTESAKRIVAEAEKRLRGVMAFDFVPPDYYADYPKACMGGWGSAGLNVTPDGTVLPCHAAQTIPTLSFENVKDKSLSDIWYKSEAFNAYRGTDWLPDPCQTCDRKEIDFGGCRCQALAIAGDANATDPVCKLAPGHKHLVDALAEAQSAQTPMIWRSLGQR